MILPVKLLISKYRIHPVGKLKISAGRHSPPHLHLVDQVHKAAEVILVQMGQDEQVDIGDISLGEEL